MIATDAAGAGAAVLPSQIGGPDFQSWPILLDSCEELVGVTCSGGGQAVSAERVDVHLDIQPDRVARTLTLRTTVDVVTQSPEPTLWTLWAPDDAFLLSLRLDGREVTASSGELGGMLAIDRELPGGEWHRLSAVWARTQVAHGIDHGSIPLAVHWIPPAMHRHGIAALLSARTSGSWRILGSPAVLPATPTTVGLELVTA